MAPANSTVFVVEQTLKNGHHEHPFSQGESRLPPASPGGFPRSANGSDPGSSYYSFWVGPQSVGFVCKILNEVSGSHSPCFPILKPHRSLVQASGSSYFCFRTSSLGSLMLASHPLLLGGDPPIVVTLLFGVAYPSGWVLTILHLHPFLPF